MSSRDGLDGARAILFGPFIGAAIWALLFLVALS